MRSGGCAEETRMRFGGKIRRDAPKELCSGGNLAEGNPKGAQAGAGASIRARRPAEPGGDGFSRVEHVERVEGVGRARRPAEPHEKQTNLK